MKKSKLFLSILLISLCINSLNAQELRLNAYSSYAFDDNVYSYDIDGTLRGGYLYGGGIEMRAIPFLGLELSYLRLDSEFPYITNNQIGILDYGLNYFMLGFNKYLPLGRVEPFVGVQVGMSVLDIKQVAISDIVKFAWAGKIGTDIHLTPAISLRMQAQINSIVQSMGAGLSFGLGGISPTVNAYSSVYQFSIGGGLVITLPNKNVSRPYNSSNL